jgi:hypothetical protein
MLKEILSISGKPGLYKLISQAKNMIIVESLVDGKRMPAHSHDRVISLGDVAMFTDTGEVPLREVFNKMKEKTNGEKAISEKSSDIELQKFFAEILPDYDRERVHKSDVKKLFAWFNLLIEKGYTDFSEKAEDKEDTQETEEKASE